MTMFKIKVITSVCIFSILLGITSIIKTQTRISEKKIFKIENKIAILKKDLHETQLDYFYMTSPSYLSKKINEVGFIDYMPMHFSRIYLNYIDFMSEKQKVTILKKR